MTPPTPRFVRAGRRFWRGLVDVLYPPLCLGCEARLPDPYEPLCALCLGRLARAEPADVQAELAKLPAAQHALDDTFVLWRFDKGGTVQRVQHALKYGNRPRYGVALGRRVGQAMQTAGLPPPDAIVPIPLHRVRLLERGYNQSAALAEGLADVLGALLRPDALARAQPTRSQTRLSRTERWQNVQTAFAVPQHVDLTGQRLLLVDDVITTGATALAAAQTLRAAGAAHLTLAALAMA